MINELSSTDALAELREAIVKEGNGCTKVVEHFDFMAQQIIANYAALGQSGDVFLMYLSLTITAKYEESPP